MAGEFIRWKWETHFLANDLDKNGVISIDDANIFSDRFILHHKMEGKQARQLRTDFQAIWTSLFLFDREIIDRTTFLELTEKEYSENRSGFVERHNRVVRAATELFDTNKDGCLSEEEYVIASKCWGVMNLDRKYVQAIPHIKPGFINNEVFIESWIAFHTNGDANNADAEKSVMFGLGMIDHM